MISADSKVGAAGPQSGSYVAVDTIANITSGYSAADYINCIAYATDLKCDVRSNGSRWAIASGSTYADAGTLGYIFFEGASATASQSGTTVTVTQTSHGLTADQNGCSVYLYQSSGSFAATNGWYTNFTYVDANTFTCTCSVSGTVSPAENLTANNAETFMPDLYTVPSTILNQGLQLVANSSWKSKSNANNKTAKFYFSDVAGGTTTVTTGSTYTGITAAAIFFPVPDATKFVINAFSTALQTVTTGTAKLSVTLAAGAGWSVVYYRSFQINDQGVL